MTESDRRLLVILALDETLVHVREEPLERPGDLQVDGYHGYRRPHLEAFLRGAAERFRLAVWSSASEDYVAQIVEQIAPGLRLEFAWGRSRCVRKMNFQEYRVTHIKDLKKVRAKGYDLRRVLIVDDSPEKLSRNYGNAVYLLPWEGAPDDVELPALLAYLHTLGEVPDVRSLEKRHWRTMAQPTPDTSDGPARDKGG